MNRVTKRTWLMALFLAVLLGGMGFFLWEYATEAESWATAAGSPHLYNNGNIGCGIVTDRSGNVLLDMNGVRAYSANPVTRMSTMHWMGDRNGFISAGAVSNYVGELSGFDIVNGVYHFDGVGGTIKLTISERMQNAALNALGGRKGTVAVYNYRTGEILCAVTSPTYDPDNVPNLEGEEYEGVFLNRFLQAAYTPGSIFKVVTTVAALETVPDILDKTFTCYGEYTYGTEAVTCETAHGVQNLQWALAHSCNCAFAQIAQLIGRKNMTKRVDAYQVVKTLKFDGVSCASGNYDNKDTGGASFAWSCIGQHTDLVNPCRFMTFMGSIAAGGRGVEPYIVSEVQSGDDVTYRAKVRSTDKIMDEETAEIVRSFMRNNVVNVYGDENFPGFTVCAKSGTSQLGGGQTSNAMFAGFTMDEQYPLAFVIVVENGGYGAYTCVPILSAVLAECRASMNG